MADEIKLLRKELLFIVVCFGILSFLDFAIALGIMNAMVHHNDSNILLIAACSGLLFLGIILLIPVGISWKMYHETKNPELAQRIIAMRDKRRNK